MLPQPYQPRYQWRMTQLDADHVPSEIDWSGFDGALYIGRIRKEIAGPTKGKWLWAGSFPYDFRGRPPLPNNGYVATAREAVRFVEEYWDKVRSDAGEVRAGNKGYDDGKHH